MPKAADDQGDEPKVKARPPVQLSVREWALARGSEVGFETAYAFISTFGRDTGTDAELTAALGAFRSHVVT